jgi:hypothetical protein
MGTIVLLLLLGWLACTALLTMGVGVRARDGRTDKVVQSISATNHRQNVSPSSAVSSPRETSGSPAGVD